MPSGNDCQPFIEHLQQEHRRLAELLSQMQAGLHCGKEDGSQFVQKLVQLRDELDRHYTEEEAGGCLEEAECRCPSLAGEVKRIEAEHVALRREMDRLVAQADELAKASQGFELLERALREFVTHVRQHEAAENRILVYGFGAEALDEFTAEPSQGDAGPCACGTTPTDQAESVNLQE